MDIKWNDTVWNKSPTGSSVSFNTQLGVFEDMRVQLVTHTGTRPWRQWQCSILWSLTLDEPSSGRTWCLWSTAFMPWVPSSVGCRVCFTLQFRIFRIWEGMETSTFGDFWLFCRWCHPAIRAWIPRQASWREDWPGRIRKVCIGVWDSTFHGHEMLQYPTQYMHVYIYIYNIYYIYMPYMHNVYCFRVSDMHASHVYMMNYSIYRTWFISLTLVAGWTQSWIVGLQNPSHSSQQCLANNRDVVTLPASKQLPTPQAHLPQS